jgi:hypothetical protein
MERSDCIGGNGRVMGELFFNEGVALDKFEQIICVLF